MAVDPSIALRVRAPDIGQAFSNALLNLQSIDRLSQFAKEAPLRNRLLEAQTQAAEANVPTDQQRFSQRENEIISSLGVAAQQIIPDLQAGRNDQVMAKLQRRREDLLNAELPVDQTDEAIQLLQTNPAELLTRSQQAVDLASSLPSKGVAQFGGQQTFKDEKGNLFFGTTKRDPSSGGVQSVLVPVSGGDAQPVGRVSLVSGLGQTAAEKQASIIETKAAEQKIVGDIETAQKVEQAKRLETESVTASQKKELDKLRIDETKIKNENEKKQLIDAKNARRIEALAAVDQVNGLLKDDRFSAGFGKLAAATPDIVKSQDTLDVIAEKEQIIGLLSLESRQKLKGQGTISDSETETLEKSATVLANPLISDDLARKELIKVRNLFERAAARNQLKKETREAQAEQAAQEQAQQQAGGIQEGATATNPQTGQKVVFTNGQWQPAP